MTDERQTGAASGLDSGSEAPGNAHPLEVAEPNEVTAPPDAPAQTEPSEVSVTMVHRQGPLPAPLELQAYFDIDEFVGRCIVEMARDSAKHRHRMEHRSFWVVITVVLCVTVVMLAVVATAAWVAAEVSVVGGVLVLLASPAAVLWTLLARLLRRLRHRRGDPRGEDSSGGS